MRKCWLFVLACAALVSPATAAAQTTVDFDHNAAGNPLAAPCGFDQTAPLTELYAMLGVRFSGPAQLQGGAILNECGNFGVPARSGTNFLAFNRALYGKDPETIRFDALQRTVT